MHRFRLLLITLFILLISSSLAIAKTIYDDSGRISINVSNNWVRFPVDDDSATKSIFSVAFDKDSAIILKQGKFYSNYQSMKSMSETDKFIMIEKLVDFHSKAMKSKGYSVDIDKIDCLKDAIMIGLIMKKNSNIYVTGIVYYIKDYIIYSLCVLCTPNTAKEVIDAVSTLRIDGELLSNWMTH